MKKLLRLALSALLLLTMTVPAQASSEEPATASSDAPETTEPMELTQPGIRFFDSVTVGGKSTGGSFYLYSPEHPHDYDILSNCMNGVVFVYPDKPLADEDAAEALIAELGLDEIAESFPAYIILPLPQNGESWTEADLDLYWEAQFFLAGGLVDANTQPPQGEYVRHTMNTLQYVIGEGSGASFIHNVLSQNAARIAGIAAFGGEIDEDLPIGLSVPAYLVNAPESVVSYWRAANGTDAGEGSEFYNSTYVQKKVFVAEGGDTFDRENVQTAWRNILSRTMRLGVAANVVVTTMDQSEWVLMDWLELEDIGLNRYTFEFDAASGTAEYYTEYKTKSYDTVHLYVPAAVESEPDKAVPLLVTLHGGSDDPLNIVMGCGWAQKAVDENFIIVSPSNEDPDHVISILDYVDGLYNIDHSRIYVTGFSMGGMGASNVGKAHPEVFAAIAPMGSAGGSYIEDFDSSGYDLPVCMIVGGSDNLNVSEDENGDPVVGGMMPASITQAFEINELNPGEKDYSANPYWGYTPNQYQVVIDKDLEWRISSFYRDDFAAPMVQCVTLIGAGHSNADYMATIAWDFMSRFARAEDGSLLEN